MTGIWIDQEQSLLSQAPRVKPWLGPGRIAAIHDMGLLMVSALRTIAITGALAALTVPASAATIDSVVGADGPGVLAGTATGSQTGNQVNGSATFGNVDVFDVALGFQNEGGTCSDSSAFPNDCTAYDVDLQFTNQTGTSWTDFHLRVGSGGLWTDGSDVYPLLDEDSGFDLRSGRDQTLQLSAIEGDRFSQHSVVSGEGGGDGEGDPDLGVFPVGINWFDGAVADGETVDLGFSVVSGDVTGLTNFNTDNYGYPSDTRDGYVMTARIYPTVASVPTPGSLALVGIGLAALGFSFYRWARPC